MANRQHNGKSVSRSAPRSVTQSDDQPVQPDNHEQSGSAGRPTIGRHGSGQDTGQGRYGQSGMGGKGNAETEGQAAYRRSGDGSKDAGKSGSNQGSGSSDALPEDERNLKDDKPKSIKGN